MLWEYEKVHAWGIKEDRSLGRREKFMLLDEERKVDAGGKGKVHVGEVGKGIASGS